MGSTISICEGISVSLTFVSLWICWGMICSYVQLRTRNKVNSISSFPLSVFTSSWWANPWITWLWLNVTDSQYLSFFISLQACLMDKVPFGFRCYPCRISFSVSNSFFHTYSLLLCSLTTCSYLICIAVESCVMLKFPLGVSSIVVRFIWFTIQHDSVGRK